MYIDTFLLQLYIEYSDNSVPFFFTLTGLLYDILSCPRPHEEQILLALVFRKKQFGSDTYVRVSENARYCMRPRRYHLV